MSEKSDLTMVTKGDEGSITNDSFSIISPILTKRNNSNIGIEADPASEEPPNTTVSFSSSEKNMKLQMSVSVTSSRRTAVPVSWITYILICLFGIGSWVAINGMWAELPVLVPRSPEEWSLPSYLTVVSQIANIGPLIYSISNKLAPKIVHERPAVYCIVFIGSIACVLLAIFWNRTSFILGTERSTALIILTFFVALVDCTSTVVFLPFMAIFPEIYMSALYTGESFSGLLPSLVALGQGISKNESKLSVICIHGNKTCNNITSTYFTGLKFSPNCFFVFLSFMMIVSGFAFTAINFLPLSKKVHVKDYSSILKSQETTLEKRLMRDEEILEQQPLLAFPVEDQSDMDINCTQIQCCINQSEKNYSDSDKTNYPVFLYLLVAQAWINCLSNGVISAIQAYACEPYGTDVYHLAATLSGIASALTCFAFMWMSTKSSVVISVCSFLYTLLSAYIIMLSAQSPNPILKGTTIGKMLVILAFVLSGVLVSYAKLAICTIMRQYGHKALFWCGVAIQTGSFLGAIVMFPLVNVVKLFKE